MCARSATSSTKHGASSLRLRSGQGWIAAGVAAVAIVALAANLPANGFYSGDSGVKLIAAINAIDHPGAPFDIELPRIAGNAVPYVERFFEAHGDHAHALQSPVFPLLTAPFVAAAGLRGAYVLPALCFILLTPLLVMIARELTPETPAWMVALVAVAANPVFFYALELWEHVPAVTLLAAATAWIRRRPMLAGVAAAMAMLLRPEAAWFAAGLLLMARRWTTFVIGAIVALAPFAIYNVVHSGNALGPHTAANLAPLADDWMRTRIERTALWLTPSSFLPLTGFAIVAAAHIARAAGVNSGRSQAIALAGAVVVGYAAIGNDINRESLWRAWPLATVLLVPGVHPRNALWIPALLSTVAVLLLSTHDGGAQWGPRFLLIASPALVVLACAALHRALDRRGDWFPARAVLVGLLVFASVSTSRDAYRELRAIKQFYARVTDMTAQIVPAGGYVVSRVWWFDQITAALYGRHTVLSVDDDAEERAALQQLQAAGVNSTVVVMSDVAGERRSPPQTEATCFRAVDERRLAERNLRFISLACAF